MRVDFDDAAADRLVTTLRHGADSARAQGSWRTSVVTAALMDFQGAVAESFCDGVSQERDDRWRLAQVLEDLADQVEAVKRKAREERQRLAALAAWEQREEARKRARDYAFVTGGVVPDFASWDGYDRKPDEYPVVGPPLYAVFQVHPRPRSARHGLGPGGVTSADPQALVEFVSQWRRMDAQLAGELDGVRQAWWRFVAACSWARIDHVNLESAFRGWVDESNSWLGWVGQIAAAFQTAGSGGALGPVTLSNAHLGGMPDPGGFPLWAGVLDLLLAVVGQQSKDPADIATWWATLSTAQQDQIIAFYPTLIGNLDGIPPNVRNECNLVALDRALVAAREEVEQWQKMSVNEATGFAVGVGLAGALERLEQLEDLKRQLDEWNTDPRKKGNQLSLLGFRAGTPHIQAIVAVGDVASASNIITHVPGMETTVGGDTISKAMATLDTQRELADRELRADGGQAAGVFWLGYDPPMILESLGSNSGLSSTQAQKAAADLVRFSYGLQATSNSVPLLTLSAHSYGTEVGFYALADPTHLFDKAVFSGSPGYPGTPVHLNKDDLYVAFNTTDPITFLPEIGHPLGIDVHGIPITHPQNVNRLVVTPVIHDGQAFVGTNRDGHNYTRFGDDGKPIPTSTDLNTALIASGQDTPYLSNEAFDAPDDAPYPTINFLGTD